MSAPDNRKDQARKERLLAVERAELTSLKPGRVSTHYSLC